MTKSKYGPNPYTGADHHIWDQPDEPETGEATLARFLEASFANRHPLMARHDRLAQTAREAFHDGKLDWRTGMAGVPAFLDEVASRLERPDHNGRTGLVDDIMTWQEENGF